MPQRAVVGPKRFEAILPADSDTMVAIIDAIDEALDKVLKSLVEWTLLTCEGAQCRS